jgi:O-antigen polymerase
LISLIILAGYLLVGLLVYIPNEGGTGLHLPQNILCWMVIATLSLVLLAPQCVPRQSRPAVRVAATMNYLLAGTLLLTLPLLWSPSPLWQLEAAPRILGLWGGLVFYFALLQQPLTTPQRRVWLLVLLLSVWGQAVLAHIQMFAFSPGVPNWMEFDAAGSRPYGIFQQINVLASFVATGYAIALYLSGSSSSRVVRGLSYASVLVFTTLLVLLQSRIGGLGYLVAGSLLLGYQWARGERKHALLMLGLSLAGVIAGVAVLRYAGSELHLLRHDIDGSTSQRILFLKCALSMIGQHPFVGWGYGGFEYYFPREMAAQHLAVGSATHPHNELLFGWAEGGVVALAGMLLFVGAYVSSAWSRLRAKDSIAVLVLPIGLHLMTEFPLYESVPHWLFLLVLLRLMVSEGDIIVPADTTSVRWLRGGAWCGALFSLAIVGFMGTGWPTTQMLTRAERAGVVNVPPVSSQLNPFIQWDRYQFDLHTQLLMQFNRTRDPALLNAYADWAYQYSRVHNDANVYAYLIAIEQFRQQSGRVKILMKTANMLFPFDVRFQQQ